MQAKRYFVGASVIVVFLLKKGFNPFTTKMANIFFHNFLSF